MEQQSRPLTPTKTYTGIVPFIILSCLFLVGIFNFTLVNEAFWISAIVLCISTVAIIFSKRYAVLYVKLDKLSIIVFLWALWVCLSVLWSVNISVAFQTLVTYTMALAFFFIARSYVLARPEAFSIFIRCICWVIAILALFSIEMASSGFLRTLYTGPLSSLFRIQSDDAAFGLWVEGSRMQSIMGLPNLYATFAGMGACLALWLVLGAKKIKAVDVFLAQTIGVSLFLTSSRGGWLCFLGALVVMVLLSSMRTRNAFRAGLLTVINLLTALIMMPFMGKELAGGVTVFVILAFGIIASFYLYRLLEQQWEKIAKIKKKTLLLAVGGCVILVVGYIIVGLLVRSAFPLYTPEAKLYRSTSLPSGTYQVSTSFDVMEPMLEDGPLGVGIIVESASRQQASMQTSTMLLEALTMSTDATFTFTVPEGAVAVSFTLVPVGGRMSVTGVQLTNTAGFFKALPLEYNLLPESIVSRVQGIFNDPNVLQRFVYWQDGLRIAAQSPLVGQGSGSFETLLEGVSDYYYVTRHVHNHYIQALADTGIIGLLLFVLVFVCVILAARKPKHPAVPLLAAGVAMMYLHSFIEASMFNLLNVSLLFLLLGLLSGVTSKQEEQKTSKVLTGETYKAAMCIFSVLAILVIGGKLLTRQYVSAAQARGNKEAMEAYRWAVVTDPFSASAYKSACITRYLSDPSVGGTALIAQFAQDLSHKNNNPQDCYQLARYYQQTGDANLAVENYEHYLALRRINPEAWNEVLSQYYRLMNKKNLDNPEIAERLPIYYESAYRLNSYLQELNATLPGEIIPNEALMRVLTQAILVYEDGMTIEEALMVI